MPIPFLIAGAIAAAVGTAVATSEECNRCGDTFWSSDCNYYCDDCCSDRRNEARAEAARNTEREKNNEIVMEKIEGYQARMVSNIEDKYHVELGIEKANIKILFESNNFKDSILELETKASELNQLRKEIEGMKNE